MIDPTRQRALYIVPLAELELRLGLQRRGQSILSLTIDHAAGTVAVVSHDPYGEHIAQNAHPPHSELPALESITITRPRPVRDSPQA